MDRGASPNLVPVSGQGRHLGREYPRGVLCEFLYLEGSVLDSLVKQRSEIKP